MSRRDVPRPCGRVVGPVARRSCRRQSPGTDMAPPSDQVELVQRVSSRPLLRINPLRRDQFRDAVGGHPNHPFLLVNFGMVVMTQKAPIDIAGATEILFPEFDVVRVAPIRRPITTRKNTTLIPRDDGPADMGRETPRGPADVEDLGLGAE